MPIKQMPVLACAILALAAGNATAGVFHFCGDDWDDWVPGNWCDASGNLLFGKPEFGDTAIFDAADKCIISSANQEVTTLIVAGTLLIGPGRALTLYGDATVDGQLGFGVQEGEGFCGPSAPAYLQLGADITITGTGTIGTGGCLNAVAVIQPRPALPPPMPVLTIDDGGPTGTLTMRPPLFQGATVLDIRVALVNNATVGGDFLGVIMLSDDPKSGCGEWVIQDRGTFIVDAEVTGGSTWTIINQLGIVEPLVEINTDCKHLTGNWHIVSSRVHVLGGDLCTSGDLVMEICSKDPATVDVAAGHTASFGGLCR